MFCKNLINKLKITLCNLINFAVFHMNILDAVTALRFRLRLCYKNILKKSKIIIDRVSIANLSRIYRKYTKQYTIQETREFCVYTIQSWSVNTYGLK